jgi:hypothetical protein
VAAFCAFVDSKLQLFGSGTINWLTIVPAHKAQRDAAMAANRSLLANVLPSREQQTEMTLAAPHLLLSAEADQ